ncbi:MAG: amidohydrolase family protein [Acidobacteriota bacterium]
MNVPRTILCLVVLLLAKPSWGGQSGASWAIKDAVLIDGTGAPPLTGSVIVGRGDRIACVGRVTDCQIPGDATILNAAGKWVIPGLIDTHVHLNWGANNAAHDAQVIRLAFGTTTTREAGTPRQLEQNLAVKRRAEAADLAEPRLVVSGLVSPENGKADPASISAAVRHLADAGVDAIKIKQDFDADAVQAIVSEAHAHYLPVFGHTWGGNGSFLAAALAAGIDGVSHMYTFSEYAKRAGAARQPAPGGLDYWVWTKEDWNDLDEQRLSEVADTIVKQHVWFEPMLGSEKYFTLEYPLPDDVAYLGEIRSLKQLVGASLPVGDSGWSARRRRQARVDAVYGRMCEFARQLHQRGGIMITGTDGVQPGPALLDEVALLRDCGLSPMAALQAATSRAAAAIERRDLGTIEVERIADLVVLDGDPLADAANLRRVWRVVKGGHFYDPAALLAPVKAAYAKQSTQIWTIRAAGAGMLVVIAGFLASVQARRRRRSRAA